MKKWLLTLNILPIIGVISCTNKDPQAGNANTRDIDLSNPQAVARNVKNIANKLGIEDLAASVNNINLKWNEFTKRFDTLNYTDSDYETKLNDLLNENWALFLSNLDYFAYYKYPNTKWFLYPEKPNAKYSDIYKHSIGLIKIENESIPHNHIKQVDKVVGFKSFSDISESFTSKITNNTRVYVSLGRVIMQLEKVDNKVKIMPQLLYFINEPGSYSGAINGNYWEVVKEVLNVHPDNFTETLGAIIDRTTKEIGYPAYVYLGKK